LIYRFARTNPRETINRNREVIAWAFETEIFVMNNRLHSTTGLAILVGVLSLPGLSFALAADTPDDVDRILSDWNQSRDALRSMRWVLVGKVTVPKGSLTDHPWLSRDLQEKTLPAEDHTFESRTTWVFDYVANRVRKEVEEEEFNYKQGTFSPKRKIFLFDGATKTSRRYLPKKGEPIPGDRTVQLGIVANANKIDYSPSDHPVYLCQPNVFPFIGIVQTAWGPVQLRPPVTREQFAKQDTLTIKDRQCLVVKLFARQSETEFDELSIDSSNKRILRADCYSQGKLFARTEIEYAEGNRFPVGWTTTAYGETPAIDVLAGAERRMVLRTERILVKEASVDVQIDPKVFEVKLRPGMVVRKADAEAGFSRNFDAIDYRVGPDGTTLIDIKAEKENSAESTEPKSENSPAGKGLGRLLPFLVPVVLVLAGVAWLHRRRKGSR